MPVINYHEALNLTYNESKNLLLGNGFSIAQTEGAFTYKNLLEVSDIRNDSKIRKVFDKLKTVDFERIIFALENAAIVAKEYNNTALSKTLEADAVIVRNKLINAIRKVHPQNFTAIPETQIKACALFLNDYKNIYTLNYDLLLYWVQLHAGGFNDGFGLGEEHNNFRGPFDVEAHCNIYNLHGGLHLFLKSSRKLEKRIANGKDLLDSIESVITNDKRMPLFVAEASSDEKINRIESVPYLRHCYNKISNEIDNLFIFGHSADSNDSHIYDAIFSSNVRKIFFCVYNPNVNLQRIKEALAPFQTRNEDINVYYVDSETVPVWT